MGALSALCLMEPFAGAAYSQDQANQTFSLPEASPSPTPAPAPQGPADERAGVPIAPRIIPEARATTPAAAPSSTPAPAPTPGPRSNEGSSLADYDPQGARQRANPPADTRPNRSSGPGQNRNTDSAALPQTRPSNQGLSNPGPSDPGSTGPANLSEAVNSDLDALEQELENAPERSRDGWYSVDTEPSGANQSATPSASPSATSSGTSLFDRLTSQPGTALSLLTMLVLLGAIIALRILRRKRAEQDIYEEPSGALTAGVRASMAQGPESPASSPPPSPSETTDKTGASDKRADGAEPPKETAPTARTSPSEHGASDAPVIPQANSSIDIDLALEITGASRSFMRLSVDFRLEIRNRSDQALRDISIAGELACAQRGSAGPAPVDKTQPITSLERIAPGQSRRIGGTLQLPIAEISTISQNGRPVVIPLIHFRIGTLDQSAIKRSFVIGTPSPASSARVQPLLMEGPPGSLGPLRAQMIKQAASQ